MSTRCRIGKILPDDSIVSIYVHHDGYLSYTGVRLINYWNSETLVDELLNIGNSSLLRDSIEEQKEESYNEEALVSKSLSEFDSIEYAEYKYLWDNEWYLLKNGIKVPLNDLI